MVLCKCFKKFYLLHFTLWRAWPGWIGGPLPGGLTKYCPSVLDTVGWVIWPVKIVPYMTCNVFGGTLNPTLPIYLHSIPWLPQMSISFHFVDYMYYTLVLNIITLWNDDSLIWYTTRITDIRPLINVPCVWYACVYLCVFYHHQIFVHFLFVCIFVQCSLWIINKAFSCGYRHWL